jgi:hypothetical protein
LIHVSAAMLPRFFRIEAGFGRPKTLDFWLASETAKRVSVWPIA